MSPEKARLVAAIQLGVGICFLLLFAWFRAHPGRRNHFIGFRLPQAFRSEEHWRRINVLGARAFLLASAALCVIAGAFLARPDRAATRAGGVLLLMAPAVFLLATAWVIAKAPGTVRDLDLRTRSSDSHDLP